MNFKNITKQLGPVAGIAAGAIAAKKAVNLIPVGGDLVKGGAVALLGLLLTSQKGLVSSVGLGMAGQGLLMLAGNFIPGISGIETVYIQGAAQSTDNSGGQADGYSY